MIQNLWGKLNSLNQQGVLDALVWMGGNLYYVAPAGSDSGDGSIGNPYLTLDAAYARCRDGMNDAVVIDTNFLTGLSDAAASCTIRVDAAFVWAKNATHLIGLQPQFANLLISPRARLAPTSTTTAFANFFTVTGTGCLFDGIQWFHSFGTDTTSQIAVTVKGCRNVFRNCHIAGGTNITDAGARSLVLSSNASGNKGENYFENCTIGIDTVQRGNAASAVLGLIGSQVPRNYFRECLFLSGATSATPVMIAAAASAIDRFIMLQDCKFINYGTALTSLMSINATQNGTVLLENPTRYNCGNFGNTANTLITGPVTVNTTGLGSAPAA